MVSRWSSVSAWCTSTVLQVIQVINTILGHSTQIGIKITIKMLYCGSNRSKNRSMRRSWSTSLTRSCANNWNMIIWKTGNLCNLAAKYNKFVYWNYIYKNDNWMNCIELFYSLNYEIDKKELNWIKNSKQSYFLWIQLEIHGWNFDWRQLKKWRKHLNQLMSRECPKSDFHKSCLEWVQLHLFHHALKWHHFHTVENLWKRKTILFIASSTK